MSYPTFPWTVYKAMEAPTGQNVVLDPRYLTETSRIVKSEREYDDARHEGWFDKPVDAMTALDAAQARAFEHAAERTYEDRHLTDKAKQEADDVDRAAGFKPVEAIPEAPKKGRLVKKKEE